jgi:SAM-dependent methyltransferase
MPSFHGVEGHGVSDDVASPVVVLGADFYARLSLRNAAYGYYGSAMASGHDEWFADESIWKDLYPFTFPESAFVVAEEQVEKILRLTGLDGGTVLDLCCGPGRHAVALAKRGFAVTAVDRTPFLLDHARARAARANQRVEFVLDDVRRFSRPASFDLIIVTKRSYPVRATRNRRRLDADTQSLDTDPSG